MHSGREDGVALIVAVMAMLLMTALGMALVLTSTTETRIAANFRDGYEAVYAADAAMERAMDDIAAVVNWNTLLDGTARSTFVDGQPSGSRALPDGSTLDLTRIVNMANCGRVTACTARQMNDPTVAGRPWGANNPRWQLYAYGRLSDMLPGGAIASSFYAVLLVADDSSENDGDPLHDGASPDNPGSGLLALRAEAFGPRGAHAAIEATLARGGAAAEGGARMLSWRAVR